MLLYFGVTLNMPRQHRLRDCINLAMRGSSSTVDVFRLTNRATDDLFSVGADESFSSLSYTPSYPNSPPSSHAILRPLPPLRRLPIDILIRHLNIARLAMHTILRIYLEPYPQILTLILHILIHTRRTKPILHALILRPLHLSMLIPVHDLQVTRLVLLVVRTRAADAREDVEGDLAVGFRVLDFLSIGLRVWSRRGRLCRA